VGAREAPGGLARAASRAAVLLVLAGLLAVACASEATDLAAPPSSPAPTDGDVRGGPGAGTPEEPDRPGPPGDQPPTASATTDPPGAPVRVRIGHLDVDAPIVPLDLRDDGTIEVPPDHSEVGWYRHGARPGAPGPTVLGAHVDWAGVPGVFRDLAELPIGARIEVADEHGRWTSYEVGAAEVHRKDAFPTFAVYGTTSEDTLRLVTCTGPFDPDLRSHRDNLVVFATAVDETEVDEASA
jgi:sortase (surface protein transpeptidase)